MQLFIILALLLYGGKGNAQNLLQEVRPMLESFGGEQVQEALKSADEISQVLSAVNAFSGGTGGEQAEKSTEFSQHGENQSGFPLEPISRIADRDITYSLSKYISQA
ncbi:MAG: hypothetical protein K2H30_04725 [Clostridia bacterium]|nr:hypothetical protein [Clostridia bacterium]MDE7265304.1 hypothetical protein [Clostridia bacterium]